MERHEFWDESGINIIVDRGNTPEQVKDHIRTVQAYALSLEASNAALEKQRDDTLAMGNKTIAALAEEVRILRGAEWAHADQLAALAEELMELKSKDVNRQTAIEVANGKADALAEERDAALNQRNEAWKHRAEAWVKRDALAEQVRGLREALEVIKEKQSTDPGIRPDGSHVHYRGQGSGASEDAREDAYWECAQIAIAALAQPPAAPLAQG